MSTTQSIAEALKAEIDRYSVRMRDSHPLVLAAKSGQVSKQLVARYLASLRCLLRHTPPHLVAAVARARVLGRPDLERYFEHKLVEETGHDAWADSDLGVMAETFRVENEEPAPAMSKLVEYLGVLAAGQPVHYAVYILFVERFTVVAGDQWVAALVQHCDIPERALTAVTRHVELDQGHVDEAMLEFDTLMAGASAPELVQELRVVMRLLEAFYDELFASMSPTMIDRAALSAEGDCQIHRN